MSQIYDQDPPVRPVRRRRRRRSRLPRLLLIAALPLLLAAFVLPRHDHAQADHPGPYDGRVLSAGDAAVQAPYGGVEPKTETAAGNNTGDIAVPDWITQDLLPLNQWSRPGDALPQVNGVVVHYVGNPGTTAEQNRSYFGYLAETHETFASSHFVIGMDGTVIQCVPLNEISYCSNDRNGDTIAIECCHPDDTGKFTEETMASLQRLVNWLAETYSLGREDILRHYDVTGKECPKYFYEHPDAWEAFLDGLTFPK